MNREQIADLLHQHDKVNKDTLVWTCKCGEKLHTLWIEHIIDVITDAWPQHEPRVIPSRRSDPSTSHSSAASITMRAGSQRARLLASFAHGPRTDEKAMELAYGVSPASEYSKRCSELREVGLIEPTGETERGRSGQQRMVSAITPEGIRWLDEHRD